MRKFTKEITALLAAAAVSASYGAITASSEEIEATAGVMVAPTEDFPAVDGGMMPSDDYIEQPTTTALMGTYVAPSTTTTATNPPFMGATTTTKLTTTTLIDTYTTCTTATTTIPPLAGEPLPPDEYIDPPTEEEFPPLAGAPLPPDDFIVTTNTTFPPLMGTFISTTESTIATTTTTTADIPPIMGDMMLPDGDINCDGKFGIADIVSMQKWLLGSKSVDVPDWKRADLYPDGQLDVYDACLMREKLLKKD